MTGVRRLPRLSQQQLAFFWCQAALSQGSLIADVVLLMGQLQGPPWRNEVDDTTLPSRGFHVTGEQGWASPLPEKPLEPGGENTNIY